MAALPGFASTYADLTAWTLRLRPARRLPKAEAAIERVVRRMLGEPLDGDDDELLSLVTAEAFDLAGIASPRGYRPFLPVPLWGDFLVCGIDRSTPSKTDETGAGATSPDSAKRKRAARQQPDEVEKSDP
ncbi:MAG: hypothetical protein HC871_08955, partial [Rhizobiales bacterium]|nr:hypothetical protein [Hyphomicrobiales bacterium]